MKLLVLGASGGCGAHVVRLALARGHEVTALVRADTAYEAPAGAVVVRDDVLRPGAIAEAARGRDAIVSCLGIRRKHPGNPWSGLVSPADFTSRSAQAIVDAARAAGIRRVVAISAAGVADSAPRMSALLRFVFAISRVGTAYRDLAAMEAVFAASDLDWTCVRPVTLANGAGDASQPTDRFALTAKIDREAVAAWILDHLDHLGHLGGDVRRTPMIQRKARLGRAAQQRVALRSQSSESRSESPPA